jgi:hypothetical protein
LIDAALQGPGQIHTHKIYQSVERPGKFQVSIDGLTLMPHFDTQSDAQIFLMGFSLGRAAGSGSKNPSTA